MENEKLEEKELQENKQEEPEIAIDNDGVITNLSEIKKQKESLIKIYKELDELSVEILDDKIKDMALKIKEHVSVLEEMEQREFERQEQKREEEIKEAQRISVHYLKNKPEIIKQADDAKIPWSILFWLLGATLMGVAIIITILLCK